MTSVLERPVVEEEAIPTMEEFTTDNKVAALKVMAVLGNVPLEVKEFQTSWFLITYDMPHSPEGDKARHEFLVNAATIGAIQHTESVYLLPWIPEANMEAIKLAEVGKVYVWYAKASDEMQAADLTREYDRGLRKRLEKLEARAIKILEHASQHHDKRAESMLEHTWPVFNGLARAVAARGSVDLAEYMEGIRTALNIAAGNAGVAGR